jgi:hypothetical protein
MREKLTTAFDTIYELSQNRKIEIKTAIVVFVISVLA